ncbi:MAG: hypothetical protein J0M13_19495 [Candidatus Accumulibacter sp.]|jgi:hypothetical protein|nr:hypothetical protein [Candidatus Accumulibacter necessarius]
MFDNLKKFAAAYAVASGGILRTCLSLWNVRQELQTSHYYGIMEQPPRISDEPHGGGELFSDGLTL